MGDNAVNESVEVPIDAEQEETEERLDTFPLAIRELGEALFLKYDEKTSNLTDENIQGIIRCNTLNDYMQERYGIRYTVLDTLIDSKMKLVMSRNGYGVDKLIELIQSIQASFQQAEVAPSLGQNLLRRR